MVGAALLSPVPSVLLWGADGIMIYNDAYSGFAGARELRTDLKVLFITGYAENAVLNSGHLTPDMQVLTKPFAVDDLAVRIRKLVTGSPSAPSAKQN